MSGARGLTLVGASAGSGKTHHLTQEVVEALKPGHEGSVDLSELVAITYTRKAQSELEARIRQALEHASPERALEIPLASLGTVHSVCLRLVRRFALEGGLSPKADVIPGEAGRRLLRAALEQSLSPELRLRLDGLAERLKIGFDAINNSSDWSGVVDQVMTLARSNRIRPEQLTEMAERAWSSYAELLTAPERDGAALNGALQRELELAIAAVSTSADQTKGTADYIERMNKALRALSSKRDTWDMWVGLATKSPTKKSLALVARVQEAAAAYERHPALHGEIREFITAVYAASRQVLERYGEFKRRHRLLDYVDMIDLALDLVLRDDVAAELRHELGLVVVDEFQDTSPVQLALFTRLHELSRRSVWVGDPKQCIFEYAGADPELMGAASDWVMASGGARDHLTRNYRSRPELVRLTSELFAQVFAPFGVAPETVRCDAYRPAPEALSAPAVGVWHFEAGTEALEIEAVAEGVARLLEHPELTPVVDRGAGSTRPPRALRPSDIAVLFATNKEARELSLALGRRGIRTVLPRTGLVLTPEGTLVRAGLRLLVDARDTLAIAEIEALMGFRDGSAEAWLEAWVGAHQQASLHDLEGGWCERLRLLHDRVSELSPVETLDSVLVALELDHFCARWPEPEQRLGNLEALRALAVTYEKQCRFEHEAATVAGLLRFFDETQDPIQRDGELQAADAQHQRVSQDAVVLSTYHKAKGLEWPVVILGSLDRAPKRTCFDVLPETDAAAFDAADPLKGRWIRYWPWPFGNTKNLPLRDRAEGSAIGKRVSERERRERLRLLYVAFTRARDHLVLPVRRTKSGKALTTWLDELGVLRVPSLEETELTVQGVAGFAARVWSLPATVAEAAPPPPPATRTWFASFCSPPLPNYWLVPSHLEEPAAGSALGTAGPITTYHARLPLGSHSAADWTEVGNAVHAFLAADQRTLSTQQRTAIAQRLLEAQGFASLLSAAALVKQAEAFWQHLDERWPGAELHREIPITARIDDSDPTRRLRGSIDLLVETSDGVVVIDHKTFPGAMSDWAKKSASYAPQLFAYRDALTRAGKRVLGCYVHFPVGGGMVEVLPASPTS